jgi:Arc/MetJ family transcription regulator
MRTNIDIDDELMAQAMHAGPYSTKKETVEAGLRLLARQAAYREILKWEGKLKWEGGEAADWAQAPQDSAAGNTLRESRAVYSVQRKDETAAPPADGEV